MNFNDFKIGTKKVLSDSHCDRTGKTYDWTARNDN
jgi:hypothetical protein